MKILQCLIQVTGNQGYGSNQKGYRLYDLDRKKVVHSRDVTFDEASTPGVEKEVASTYVELNYQR